MMNIRLILIIAICFYSCKRTNKPPADANNDVLIKKTSYSNDNEF